jgi:hypothetical protein
MRKLVVGALSLACLALIALLIVAAPVLGQEAGIRMDIPVTFLAGDTVFPAGMYIIRVDERFRVLAVQGKTVSAKMMLATKSTRRAPAKVEKASLSLQRYGDTYVLRNVWQRNDADGWALARSQKEKELASAYRGPMPTMIEESSN